MGHGVGHGDRRSEWLKRVTARGMGRGVGDRSGLKWVVGMANWSRRGSRRSEIGDRSGGRRLEIGFCCDAGFFFFFF